MENNGTTKEKVIVLKAAAKEWQGKTFYEIELEDGRVGSSNDKKFTEIIGKETEVEIKDSGKEYKGVKKYYFNLPGQANSKKTFAPKDYTADKKMCALTNAVNSVKQTEGKVTSEAILKLADKYFEWLNQK